MKTEEIDDLLKDYLIDEEGLTKVVAQAMNYSMTVGGKRLRPNLMYEAYRCFGGSEIDEIAPFMAAIEMIHNYSLCHDDLPAMDNDMYRRGELTTHAKYGEAMGILAGDGLLTHAFCVASMSYDKAHDPGKVLRSINILAKKSGVCGMLGGQSVDIEGGEKNIDLYTVTFIHKNKTAALIEAALMVGAVMAGAGEDEIKCMEALGEKIGIAFQIQDDILDVSGDFKELGKTIGSDDINNKTTYVSLVGLDESKQEQSRLFDEAASMISELSGPTDGLTEILNSLIGRKK